MVLVFSCLAILALLYQLGALLALWSFRRRPQLVRHQGPLPGITVLKPLRGVDEDTAACLSSFVAQDYPLFQVLFGVAEVTDPVVPLVEELQRRYPDRDLQLVHCPQHLGSNPKVSTLQQLLPQATHDLLVISDSDVLAPPDLLQHLATALQNPRLGVTSCLYRAGSPETLGSALEALAISADFIPSVAVAHYLEGVRFALGAVMAIRRETLTQIGGLASMADYLADDYQLGWRAAQAGWQVSVLPLVVATLQRRTTVKGFLAHQLRWARTYRVCRPRGFLGYGITFALIWSLVAWWASGFTGGTALLVGCCFLGRALVAWQAAKLLGQAPWSWQLLLLLPGKDILSFGLWALSFCGDSVIWQGRRYRVQPDGRLTEIPGKERHESQRPDQALD